MDFETLRIINGEIKRLILPDGAPSAPERPGQIAFSGSTLKAARMVDGLLRWQNLDFSSLYEPEHLLPPGTILYDFTSTTFANNAYANNVRSLTSYRNQPSLGFDHTSMPYINNQALFDLNRTGVHLWTVPRDGNYRLTAKGARGAIKNGTFSVGRVSGVFRLRVGDILRFTPGLGLYRWTRNYAGSGLGGGGASYVDSLHRGLLLVGAGSGGAAISTTAANAVLETLEDVPATSLSGYAYSGMGGGGYASLSAQHKTTKAKTPSFLSVLSEEDPVGSFPGDYGTGRGWPTGGAGEATSGTYCGGGGGYSGGNGGSSYGKGGSCFVADFAESPSRSLVPISQDAPAANLSNLDQGYSGYVKIDYLGE